MNNKYHINEKGDPAKCTAREKECPLGGEHFNNKEDAYKAYEKDNKNLIIPKMTKTNRKIIKNVIQKKQYNTAIKLIKTNGEKLYNKIKDSSDSPEKILYSKESNKTFQTNLEETHLTEDSIEKVSKIFPEPWIETVQEVITIKDNNLNIKKILNENTDKTFFGNHYKTHIEIPGRLIKDTESMDSNIKEYVKNLVHQTLAHELTHRINQNIPEVLQLNKTYLHSRIKKFSNEIINKDSNSVYYKNDFSDPYMGREYFHGDNEILTRSIEVIFFETDKLRNDDNSIDKDVIFYSLGLLNYYSG